MKYRILNFTKIIIGVMALALTSCDDFIDINADPNNPTQPEVNLLLPATQLAIVGNYDGVNRGASAVAQHRGSGSLNRYNQTGTTFQSSWIGFYTEAIPDLETIITQGTEEEEWGYVAIAKLQKAFLFSVIVDLWGNAPYFEVTRSANPVFDDGEVIYEELTLLIDEALADMDKGFSVLSSSDLFYQGDKEKWTKMANSLKFKLLLQMRNVQPEASSQGIKNLLSGGMLIDSNDDDFSFLFGTNTAPNSRHPWYADGYSTGRDGYVSMVIVDRLKEQDDPRLRYYIFRISEKAGLANSQVGEGYYGRYPGDGTSSPADLTTRAITGLYPAAGLYDNGMIPSLTTANVYLNNEGAVTGQSSNSFINALFVNGDGTGGGIQPFISHSIMKFYRAEAALTLDTGEDASVLLSEAVTSHFETINELSPGFPIAQETMDGFIDRLLEQFSAADQTGKMELLMMQKWIAMYGNGVESYNDYRRTGLPELEPLINPLDVFPERFYYSETELTSNEVVLENREQLQRDQQIIPVFWKE